MENEASSCESCSMTLRLVIIWGCHLVQAFYLGLVLYILKRQAILRSSILDLVFLEFYTACYWCNFPVSIVYSYRSLQWSMAPGWMDAICWFIQFGAQYTYLCMIIHAVLQYAILYNRQEILSTVPEGCAIALVRLVAALSSLTICGTLAILRIDPILLDYIQERCVEGCSQMSGLLIGLLCVTAALGNLALKCVIKRTKNLGFTRRDFALALISWTIGGFLLSLGIWLSLSTTNVNDDVNSRLAALPFGSAALGLVLHLKFGHKLRQLICKSSPIFQDAIANNSDIEMAASGNPFPDVQHSTRPRPCDAVI